MTRKLLRTLLLVLAITGLAAFPALAGTSMTLSPSYQATPAGTFGVWTLEWGGAPNFIQDFTIAFGDGATNTYRCWASCVTGTTNWSHLLVNVDVYTESVTNGSDTSNSTTTQTF